MFLALLAALVLAFGAIVVAVRVAPVAVPVARTIARAFAATIADPVAPVAEPVRSWARMALPANVPAADYARSAAACRSIAYARLSARQCAETGRHGYGCAHRPARAPWDDAPLTATESARLSAVVGR